MEGGQKRGMGNEKQDLRAVLAKVEREGEVVRVEREVDPLLEIPAVVKSLSKLPRIPVLLFENVRGYPGVQCCAAFFGERTRVLKSMGLPLDPVEWNELGIKLLDNPLAPKLVPQGPCKENILKGPVDLEKLIFPTQGASQANNSYYHPVVFTRHPVTKQVNVGMYRVTLQKPGQVTVNLRVTQHGGMHLQAAKDLGLPLPVAVCLGVHPSIYGSATSELPYGYDELGFSGAVVGEPVEVVKAETVTAT